MSGNTQIRTITVEHPQGMHMRPAHIFAETAARFDSRIEVIKDDLRIDGKSVLSILTLGAGPGSSISLEATGPDAEEAVNALVELIQSGFPSNGTDPNLDPGSSRFSDST